MFQDTIQLDSTCYVSKYIVKLIANMSVVPDEVVVALYDYAANDPEELSIRKNEQLSLIDAKFTWWKVNCFSIKLYINRHRLLPRLKK